MGTSFRFCEPRSMWLSRNAGDKCPRLICHRFPVGRSARLDLSERTRSRASLPWTPASRGGRQLPQRACRVRDRGCGWKCGSWVEPFLQTEVGDLALLFGGCLQLGGVIVLHTTVKDVEHFF